MILNREGAKNAKGDVCWFILILEERPRINITKPCGQLTLLITGNLGVLGVLSVAGGLDDFEPRRR